MQLVLLFSEIDTITDSLEPKVTEYIKTKQTFAFESFETSSIFAVEWNDINAAEKRTQKILFYIDKEDLFIFCENNDCLQSISSFLPQGFSNEKALYMFFVNLFQGDITYLENFEAEITDVEDSTITNSKQDYLDKIISFRKELLSLKRYYEQFDLILDILCANDNQILTAEGERYMEIISGRVHRYLYYVLNLRDYVTQMREAYQAQIDIEQNQIMRVFTVIAAIFLPLTLIVGWYGMNFQNMPELAWRHGYIYVIVLSLLVCLGLIVYFKIRKWF
ncbi:MAG: CorA family divalent cation transporter [Lachnospiraceae bacterium]|jgi:magnesium transporter